MERRRRMFSFFKDRKRIILDRDGDVPYLVRYYLFLKDRVNFPFNFTLHKVLRSDEKVLHDHPWAYATLILRGGYWENVPVISQEGDVIGSKGIWRGPGHFRYRKSDDLHWLALGKDKAGNEIPCWSLFYMGKKAKSWGFMPHVTGKGYSWIDNKEYLGDH